MASEYKRQIASHPTTAPNANPPITTSGSPVKTKENITIGCSPTNEIGRLRSPARSMTVWHAPAAIPATLGNNGAAALHSDDGPLEIAAPRRRRPLYWLRRIIAGIHCEASAANPKFASPWGNATLEQRNLGATHLANIGFESCTSKLLFRGWFSISKFLQRGTARARHHASHHDSRITRPPRNQPLIVAPKAEDRGSRGEGGARRLRISPE
ncbi:hypothetical protein SAMN05519104_5151 [Rhizobiales bacterium GAS188]|nr:hypothetical protein SAMN05519104_5151 [Rhizobiales bacterium GAS188]